MITCVLRVGKSAKLAAARFAFIWIERAFSKDYASPVYEGLCSGLICYSENKQLAPPAL